MELVDKKNIRWQFFPRDGNVDNIIFILKDLDSRYFDKYKNKIINFDGGIIKKTNAKKDANKNYFEFYFNDANNSQRQLLGKLEIRFSSIAASNQSNFEILVENLDLTENKIFILPNEDEDVYYIFSDVINRPRSLAMPIKTSLESMRGFSGVDIRQAIANEPKLTSHRGTKQLELEYRNTHYPNITMELINVQPMTAPVGAIFAAMADWTYTGNGVPPRSQAPIYVMGNASKLDYTGVA